MNNQNDFIFQNLWRLTPASLAEKITDGDFKKFNYINFISNEISKAVVRGNSRIIISAPPRHGKSWLSSVWTPIWFLSHYPQKNIILTSYEADFAASWGRHVRNLINEHPEIGIRLSEDSKAADRWHTNKGGSMITAGNGGPITGRGGHLIIVDDIVKNSEQAYSETYRKKTIEWFQTTLYTRAEPGATIIVLMTRWHENDLAGFLLSEHQDKWTEIRLPALAEENDPMGRIVGEPLCPERYGKEQLDQIRLAVGSTAWNALYQQRPSSQQGNVFKREWWKFYEKLPSSFNQMILSCDLTFKDTKNSDYVVLQCWGKNRADKYLIDQVRARMDFPTTVRAIRSFVSKHPRAYVKLVEDKANGPAVIDSLKREIPGLIAVQPEGSKEARASSVTSDIEAGNVYLPSPSIAPWINDFIDECANFPNGAHDDCVDALSMALRRLRGSGVIGRPMSGHHCGVIFDQY